MATLLDLDSLGSLGRVLLILGELGLWNVGGNGGPPRAQFSRVEPTTMLRRVTLIDLGRAY